MAATFSFTTMNDGETYKAKFQSADGEEYILYYTGTDQTDALDRAQRMHKIILNLRNKSSGFIKASLYNKRNNIPQRRRIEFVEDQLCTLYICQCDLSLSVHDYRIIVNIIPHIDLAEKLTSCTNPSQNKEPILSKKFEQLSTDMTGALQSGNFSDVVLTDGLEEIPAHKLILSARSPVFAKMFQHPMKENRENRVTIKDISIEVLKGLLNFMYAGTIIIKDSKMARELYMAADKYDELKDVCSEMLKSIDLDNVLDTLLLANLYDDKLLKEAALSFISKNSSKLKALESWNTFMKTHQDLAVDILNFIIDKNI